MKKNIKFQLGDLFQNTMTEALMYVNELDLYYIQVVYINVSLTGTKEWITIETIKELIKSKTLVYYPVRN